MGEKYKDRILIDMGEFQSKILEHVCSNEFNKQFESTQFSTYEDAKGYRQAMMHGMVMASIMTSQCEYLCVREKVEKEEQGYVNVHQGHEDEYYEECSICHSNNVSVEDNYCSNCGIQFIKTNKGK